MTEEGLKSLEARVRTLELSDAESGAHRTYVAARLDKIESRLEQQSQQLLEQQEFIEGLQLQIETLSQEVIK
jgi:hypothetical protein